MDKNIECFDETDLTCDGCNKTFAIRERMWTIQIDKQYVDYNRRCGNIHEVHMVSEKSCMRTIRYCKKCAEKFDFKKIIFILQPKDEAEPKKSSFERWGEKNCS